MSKEQTLINKVAVVTGAGQGLGREHALLLSEYGASVVVNDLNEEAATQTVKDIEAAGGKAITDFSNIATFDGAEELINKAIETYGSLNILVNNAGILRDAMSFNMTQEQFESVISVHLVGHFAPSHFAAKYWRSQYKAGNEVYGRIINTTSESGLFSNIGQANYAAAKAGIASMSTVFAKELANYGVTSNAYVPRARTQMTETIPGAKEFMQPTEGEFDIWDPKNISPLVVFLCSPQASEITGQTFAIFGNEIYRFNPYTVASKMTKADQWSVEEIGENLDSLFEGNATKGIIPNPEGF
jgi:NAD(P)-dependent dehydrogenase (short-subunit alcohol dehydrogenase family)